MCSTHKGVAWITVVGGGIGIACQPHTHTHTRVCVYIQQECLGSVEYQELLLEQLQYCDDVSTM